MIPEGCGTSSVSKFKTISATLIVCLLGGIFALLIPLSYNAYHTENSFQAGSYTKNKPENFRIYSNISNQAKPEVAREDVQGGKKKSPDDLHFWTVAGVCVGAFAVIVYAFQAYLMRRTLFVSNGAAVFVKFFNHQWLYDINNPNRLHSWRFFVTVENTGATQTKYLRVYVSCIGLPHEIPGGWDFPDIGEDPVGCSLIGARQLLHLPNKEISVETLLKAKNGQIRIYMYGWVEYKDVFRSFYRHRTEFCNEIKVNGDPRDKDCVFSYHLHKEHNGADRECPKSRLSRWRKIPPISISDGTKFGEVFTSLVITTQQAAQEIAGAPQDTRSAP